jgi:hypothetical protein
MAKDVFAWIGLFLAVVVLAMAVGILTTEMLPNLFGTKRILFVVLLFAYSAYRGFRVYAYFKDKRSDRA